MAFDKIVDSAALDATFKGIADAIRSKAGTTEGMAHTAMAQAVSNLPSDKGQYVWKRYEKNETTSSGSGLGITIASTTSSSFPAGTLDIVFYKEYIYDETTGEFSGQELIKEYVQETSWTTGTILSEEEVPDGAYFIKSGRLFRTSATSRYYSYNYYSSDGTSYKYAMVNGLQEITAVSKGECVGYIVADNETAYPNNGIAGDFYYERVKTSSSGQYVWEKFEDKITESATNISINYATYYSSSYIYYSSVGTISFYPTLTFDASGKPVLGGLATTLYSSTLSQTYYYAGDVIYDATKIPDGYYFKSGSVIYKTTPDTKLVAVLSGSYVYAQFQKITLISAKRTLISHVSSDTADEYPDAGTGEDGFYYKKVLPLSLETDLIPANIRSGVNILGVTGTFVHEDDADLIASNIKKRVNILGVTGTYEGESSSELVGIKFSSTIWMS
jgi:hypothetical protein